MAVSNPLLLVLKGLHKTQSLILRSPVKEKPQEYQSTGSETQNQSNSNENGKLNNQIDDKRHLRSLDSNGSNKDTSVLFDFDLSTPKVDIHAPNKLIRKSSYSRKIEPKPENMSIDAGSSSSSSSNNFKTYEYPKITTNTTKDPLSDDIYLPSHRRQERDEKRTHNIEKEQAAMDMDNMAHIYSQLKDDTAWKKRLPKLAKINDIHDEQEMQAKRKLAIEELKAYFTKYDNWKTRMTYYKQGRQNWSEIGSRAESTDSIDQTVINKSRKRKSLSQADSLIDKKRFKSFYSKGDSDKYKVHVKFDQLIKRAHRNLEPFGQPMPLMISREFDIPYNWKTNKK